MAFGISAAVGGAIIAGGAGLAGAAISSNANKSAAQIQADATNRATDIQKQEYDQQRADQQPWRQAGSQALSQMQDPGFQKSFSMSDFQQDPGYQFRMQQGQDALQRSAAARGGLNSGAFSQALTQYGQGFASNEYQNAYNRFNNDQSTRFNRLSSLAGLGQTANAQMGQAGQNYANQVGGLMTGNANAQGAAAIGSANAWNGGLSNIGKATTDAIATNNQQDWMNKTLSGLQQNPYATPPVTAPALAYPSASSGSPSLGVNYSMNASNPYAPVPGTG